MPLMPLTDKLTGRLRELEAERAFAAYIGLHSDDPTLQELDEQIETLRAAYVGAAVTAIASLRAALGDRTEG